MIQKIGKSSPIEYPVNPALQKPSTTTLLYKSTLSSCIRFAPFSWISSFFSWILSFFSTTSFDSEFQPEVDPRTLSKRDPFFKVMFDSQYQPKNKESYKVVCEIFSILGVGGLLHWGRNKLRIDAIKPKILGGTVHPFEGLYLMLHNKKLTSQTANFCKKAPSWGYRRFLREHSEEFQAFKGDLTPCIKSFCKLLLLDESAICPMVKKREWKKLIEYVITKRMEHFKL